MADVPKYTRWEQVPAGLYTMTQLGKLDPPRRLLPGAVARARVLYHGNLYAPLYLIEDSEVRPEPTAAQVASARRAGELRYVCRWCTHVDDELLPRRICDRCAEVVTAFAKHLEARAMLGGLHKADSWRPLYGAVTFHDDGFHADRLVLVDPEEGLRVVADVRLPGGPSWDDLGGYDPYDRARQDEHSAAWEPNREAEAAALAGRALIVWDGHLTLDGGVRWRYRDWLGYRGQASPEHLEMPGATGDLAADARALWHLVDGIAKGASTPPTPCWVDAGITPAQLRPYVVGYTTRDVVKFVDGLDAARAGGA